MRRRDITRVGRGCGARALFVIAVLVPALAGGGQQPPPPAADAPPAPAAAEATKAPPAKPHPREKTLLKRQWGVEVMGVRATAAGQMLEFRYKVWDEAKAKPLFERKTKPYLVHEASGARLAVPRPAKTGPLRNSNPPLGNRVYWMFFGNPTGLVKPGERVAVVIGAFRADGLVVE